MDMIDADMEAAAKRKSCEQRLKELDDEWKRKMALAMRDCEQRIRQAKITVRDDCNKYWRERVSKARDELIRRSRNIQMRDKQKNEQILKLSTEVARLKSENAQLAERVARTAAAMTLSGMPRKRRQENLKELGLNEKVNQLRL